MAKGGARPNSGRKKGTGGQFMRTQELVKQATEGGATPLDVLVKNMRYYDMMADATQERMQGLTGIERRELAKEVLGYTQLAKDYATCAAPYIHPKLNATTVDAKMQIVTQEAALKELS